MTNLQIRILDPRIGKQWPLPHYASADAAGMDLRVCLDEPLHLLANTVELVSAGFAMHIADPGITALLLPRSGLGHKGLVLGNLTGLIDADYQGPIKMSLWNRSQDEIVIEPGERVAQMVLVPVIRPEILVVDEFAATERGSAGFGSTGQQ
ncbi:dUTP diphosphatase [Acidithiobacillus thiooxidans]|uniref:dUTP diphosphatase n=1 Tax=Acidithiobacillus thiooxidans ATCC 19377 TaxID=637390 RepID=A0A543Q107_ACITH|nr:MULTISPECIES: dUTP diphosphatase [Acidithiobacillus]MBU2810358.1 dUTP diphosphatase [Acidithiobacillus thiooxidans]MDA8176104.1 dUTP diphosphatase [Acidithiobacillus sp.]MDR7927988.1 dUTP diphosphatase [Acidithiobacillus thiooxidans]MDX5933274.1 dUTP diphosphatase [Acidithiobacillus thiooxidans]TQN50014.1 Deoxyuridine 5'-triphosphate nucleotidohydrolase [Acidithiobacillus thiooxidans ATCC 19377]